VLSDKNGNARAGHFLEGWGLSEEVHLKEFIGIKTERKFNSIKVPDRSFFAQILLL
jgi:hypothetical protein